MVGVLLGFSFPLQFPALPFRASKSLWLCWNLLESFGLLIGAELTLKEKKKQKE